MRGRVDYQFCCFDAAASTGVGLEDGGDLADYDVLGCFGAGVSRLGVADCTFHTYGSPSELDQIPTRRERLLKVVVDDRALRHSLGWW